MKTENTQQASHTPAPWKIRMPKFAEGDTKLTYCFIDAESRNLAIGRILTDYHGTSLKEAKANAELIARAPELLKENEELFSENSHLKNENDNLIEERKNLQALNAELLQNLRNAHAVILATSETCDTPLIKEIESAIAKAEGKTLVGS